MVMDSISPMRFRGYWFPCFRAMLTSLSGHDFSVKGDFSQAIYGAWAFITSLGSFGGDGDFE